MASHANRIEAGDRHFRTLLTLGAVGQQSDGDLLARFVAGLERPADDAAELAFAALVDRHGGTVLRVARTILGDEASSLDASQATFLLLARKAHSLRVADSLAPWLAAVARRVALGMRKAHARRHRHERNAARPEVVTAPSDGWNETVRTLLTEVDALPEPYRAAVVACHLDGLTQHAAAAHLGWPIGTLQSRLDRGRRKLRARLIRRGLAPSALGLLPPSGLGVSLPANLITPLARAATGWAVSTATPSLIAPGVLAILQPTKGTVMTKWLASCCALITAGVLTTGSNPGQDDGLGTVKSPPTVSAAPRTGSTTVTSIDASPTAASDQVNPGSTDLGSVPRSILPSARNPSAPAILCFVDERNLPPGAGVNWPQLIGRNYPIRVLDFAQVADEREQRKVDQCPTYLVIDAEGNELARASGPTTTEKIAQLYNLTMNGLAAEQMTNRRQSNSLRDEEDLPPPADGPDLPRLLCFMTNGDELPPPITRPDLQELERRHYPILTLDLSRAQDVANRYKVESIPAYILINGSGEELARLPNPGSGGVTTRQLAELYNKHRPKAVATTVGEMSEPTLTIPAWSAHPWETAARIKIHLSAKEWGFGSGTIIASTTDASVILTTTHIFRDQQGKFPVAGRFAFPISVDLFGGPLHQGSPARLTCTDRDLVGEVVALNTRQNFALIRIRPRRILPMSPIVPNDWRPDKGMKLISVGCSHGNDATAWDTRILDPKVKMTSGLQTFFAIKCTSQPAEGRSGGGLFTQDGYLAGISEFADPNEKVGLYTEPPAFRDLDRCLERVGDSVALNLSSLKKLMPGITLMSNTLLGEDRPETFTTFEPVLQPAVSLQEQRLSDLERKLDRVLESLDNMRGESTPFRSKGGLGP